MGREMRKICIRGFVVNEEEGGVRWDGMGWDGVEIVCVCVCGENDMLEIFVFVFFWGTWFGVAERVF